jgi:alkanesulfonate monooxygenase SsuD/methylene tetrahydromethanopterin reductase-like flavin-dependent oxidoreductase (luciferase family)
MIKLGICSLWGESLENYRAEVKLASELGYELITVGDSPTGWHELYVSLTVAAMDAPHARLSPLVTSPFLRHPLITANSLCSIDALSGGRVALGLATGGGTVLSIGRRPANQAEIRAEMDALRALFAGKPTEWDGRPVNPLRFPRNIPIYYSAFGPKALALAGEKADGVILFCGEQDLKGLAERIAAVHSAARAHGRNPASIDIWVCCFASVRPTREQAIDDLKAFIAVNSVTLSLDGMKEVPPHLKATMAEFVAQYDSTEHVVVGSKWVHLMDKLGLTEFLSRFNTFAGPVENATGLLRKMESLGVSTFIAALPGHAAPLETIKGFAAARKAM